MTKTPEQRFYEKVGPPTGLHGCREWTGAKSTRGYGFIRWEGHTNKLAHRVAWQLAYGPIPDGLTVDHVVCDNPPCVEPSHLCLATLRENILRSGTSHGAVNARKTECVRGHPLSGTNLHMDPSGRRICRACKRLENTSDRARARKAAWWRKNHGKE